jgi:hypothetical protein
VKGNVGGFYVSICIVTGILAASVSTADAADGTFVVLAVVAIWGYALAGKRGTIPGRLMGIVAFVIVVWLLLGEHSASGGVAVASGTLRGLSAVLSALGTLLSGH